MSEAYTAVLPVGDETVAVLTGLLDPERTRRGTRAGTRSLTSHDQAVLILRWFLDATRMHQLATNMSGGCDVGDRAAGCGAALVMEVGPPGSPAQGEIPNRRRLRR